MIKGFNFMVKIFARVKCTEIVRFRRITGPYNALSLTDGLRVQPGHNRSGDVYVANGQ